MNKITFFKKNRIVETKRAGGGKLSIAERLLHCLLKFVVIPGADRSCREEQEKISLNRTEGLGLGKARRFKSREVGANVGG